MAGITDALPLEEAIGIAQFMVSTHRAPAPAEWVDGIIADGQRNRMEGFF